MSNGRDHGGGLDQAVDQFGGTRSGWIDLSTGINPEPYTIPALDPEAWTALPDRAAQDALEQAARDLWQVPDEAAILTAPGVSSLIAKIPALAPPGRVHIPAPTYNEHAAAFDTHGWHETADNPDVRVLVHPNNPTGHWYTSDDLATGLTIVDESFADVLPDRSLVGFTNQPGTIVLKSFGKFWGLAGVRLGFAIGARALLDPLAEMLGPWPVSGPALVIGAKALKDRQWASQTRMRLNEDAARLDAMMLRAGASSIGGTALFRLYEVDDAQAWQTRLAQHHIWSRIFPYSETWLRLGLPARDAWPRLEAAL